MVALRKTSLAINPFEIVAILGPSGGGKSTLLHCINGLEQPDMGEVYLDKIKITPRNINQLRQKVGIVFQQFFLFRNMTVLENLIYAPKVLKLGPYKDLQKDACTLLKDFCIYEKSNELPNNLSGGQKQRVAICRALMMKPTVLLFDEPTSALDPEKVKYLVDTILKLKNRMTIILVTHHLELARIVADRIVFMDKGYILSDQSTTSFFEAPKSHRARMFLEDQTFHN